ncbi:spatacsin isoform X3 [Antennarius striatus]|uniref:spatacsin isoform X3 n=1 Tax=Antennarius striatus TaxID=241820 RepID=UPI0035B32129
MLEARRTDRSSMAVCVIPENQHCPELAGIRKAQLSPGVSLLGCLNPGGRLVLWDPADRDAPPAAVDGTYSDFCWEKAASTGGGVRLMAVGAQWDLKLLAVEAQRSTSISVVCVAEYPADLLLQNITEQNQGVFDLQSLGVLTFAAGRCCLLVNCDWLLQLQWQQMEAELQTTSCCRIFVTDDREATVHHCVCRETLFSLSASGLISVSSVSDGCLLARIDLPAYLLSGLVDDDLVSTATSFCLLQVSDDLCTAVAVTQSQAAVAIDLCHYFRIYPEHLLCAVPLQAPLRPQHRTDQDSLQSSSCCLSGLSSTFSPDRSWEARLASMYSRVQQTTAPPSSSLSLSSLPARTSWSSFLPHLESHQTPSLAHSRVPHGGVSISFSVPESSTPSLLTVSEFSAQVTFVTPGNQQATVALWDLESGSVIYHHAEGGAAPVELCGGRQHRLLLKRNGVSQVLFSVSQQDLLSRLMLFGNTATVDAVCHLNSWGRCSIPVHALQAGLKNRQLDTVDFYLKSKDNVLNPPADQPRAAAPSLTDSVQELRPALDLLCSAVKDSNSEPQSRHFSEQLLNITMSFIQTQIRLILTHTQHEDLQSCVDILYSYVTELRSYMKRLSCPAGGDGSITRSEPEQEVECWEGLQMEEVVRQSILTNQIPRAQATLRRRGCPGWRLSALRMEGLRQVYSCLQQRDLQTANTLLTNMGFCVSEQLHSICLYTDDRRLRDFLVEELSGRGCFPEEEMLSVTFIRQMEELGSLPASRCPANTLPQRVLQMVCRSPVCGGEEDLGELLGQQRCKEEVLWSNLQLDWVRNWSQSCRTAILLSRLQQTEVTSCDPAVLWYYLTALHDQHRLRDWIDWRKETRGPLQWPEITPELVNNNTICSSYLRENILDLLARKGVFIPDEVSDFEQFLWRLSQGGGVMSLSSPVLQYRSPNGLDLHSCFISFCVERGLQYLLYTYLEHYRLTPRNCPLLTNQSLSESQPWLQMLVKIQEITRDLSDPGLVFQASLTSAQVLLPDSQASLSGLLLEGHSLLALAAIMFAPGGIDQVVGQSERSERTVDLQLLKMALAAYPKLRAALFPSGSRGNGALSDVTLYHLMQSLHPLDPSHLFPWQTANPLNSSETAELPHFSSPHLVSRYALVENLDFLYYLRHGRPSFAYATFLVQMLSGCDDIPLVLQQGVQQVYRLALQLFNVPSVTSAAVCFCELLGVCSLKLRVDVAALNAIMDHNTHTSTQQLHTLGVKLAEEEPGVADELIGCLEAAVTDQLRQTNISRSSYQAAQVWALPVQFCQLHSLTFSSVYPSHCAHDGQFIHFLVFVQLHNFPAQQVRSLAAQFGPSLQAHLSLAFQDLQVYSSGRNGGSEDQTLTTREAPGVPKQPMELFRVLLQSQEQKSPYRYLLQEAVVQRCPTLAVISSCHQEAELVACLCVWVLTSVDDVVAAEATSHLVEAPQHHEWSLHDLSIIWRMLLGRGLVRPLLRGFELFQRDCPLALVLRMFELCCDYRNFSEAKAKLLDFQRTLIALRNGSPGPPSELPLQWVESQASVLLLLLLQCCSSQYDLHRLLQLLADVDKLLKSNGPDFRKLSQLSQLLQGSGVSLSPRLLQCASPSVQQEEFQAAVDALQERGCYSQARQVALLAGLSVQRLLLSQLQQEVNSQKSRSQWKRLETRVCFWRRCQDQLKAEGTDPESAFQFFLSQTEPGTGASQSELTDVQEHCLLLCLTAHWLSLLSPVPVDQLEKLEKKLWVGRIRQRVLTVSMEKESVFNLPPPTITPEMNTYESFMMELSNTSVLNTEEYLRVERVPAPSEEQQELSPEETTVLTALIGCLLDDGSIHEASRVCRYFSLHHPDVWIALRCRGLASGDLRPEAPEEAPETEGGTTMTHSASVSSLISYTMLPSPDDEVAIQLQKLVDQCRHGNKYCKQILSLYQLSKELQCSFGQICREEPSSVLEKLLLSELPERFRKAQAFIRAQGLSADSVAELVSSAVVQTLLASTQELQPAEGQMFRVSEGRDSLVQLIKICEDPNLVGVKLLENLNTVPLRDLDCIVELLIVAHDCFSLICNMEGIVRVLQVARHLSHTYLAPGEHYSLMVRLLIGIHRYNEMTYIVDLLIQNHCFEILLRKKLVMERGQTSSLKAALLDYIKRCLPADSEKHNMVALCFSMRREIGENHEMAARTQLKMIESQAWVTPDLKSSLEMALALLKDAAESFSKDSCVRQASRCVRMAKLVTLQLHFLNHGSELRIVNLRPAELLTVVISLPRVYQVFVVSEAYNYSPDWAEILYQRVILKGDFVYLEELKRLRPLPSSLFEDIFKKLDGAPSSITSNAKRLLMYCDDVCSRYRLAFQNNLYDVTKTLLQDAKTSSYLNDRLPR